MYIYLKYGEAEDERKILFDTLAKYTPHMSTTERDAAHGGHLESLSKAHIHLLSYLIHRDVSAEDLERAFGWNLQIQTAFRDIKPEVMTANVYTRTLDALGKLIDRLAKLKRGSVGEDQ